MITLKLLSSKKLVKNLIALMAIVGFAASSCCAPVDAQSLNMLHSSGRNVVDSTGKIVPLHGVSLGGWMFIEMWLSPIDSSGNLPDNNSMYVTSS